LIERFDFSRSMGRRWILGINSMTAALAK